ncbi:MAG: hypothetical protein ACI4RM_08360 [Ruminococcus sp.]
MEIEKQIKKQARESLKNNYISAVTSVFVIGGIVLVLYLLFHLNLLVFNVYDENLEFNANTVYTNIVYYADVFVIGLLAVFVSPVINGFFKLYYELAKNKETKLGYLFYFFIGIKKYFKTIMFNLLIAIFLIINFAIWFVPYTAVEIINNFKIIDGNVYSVISAVLYSLGIIGGVITSTGYFISEFTFVDDETKELSYFFYKFGSKIGRKHLKDIILLIFTLIPWIAFCFFVLPGFYVIPYFTESIATSAMWLIKLHKDGQDL